MQQLLLKDILINTVESQSKSWDYRGENTKSYTHGFHTYPAMFIPQVARRLITNYSKEGDTICDIFCGSGTTIVESRMLGRNAYGIDLNPLAILLAKVKSKELNPTILINEYERFNSKLKQIKRKNIKAPSFFNLDFWFKPSVIQKLARLKMLINEIDNLFIRDFFLVALSETVRLSSNTKNSEFKLVRINEDELNDFNPDVINIFNEKIKTNIYAMSDYYRDVDRKTKYKLYCGNSMTDKRIKNSSIDCIITSPPYGDSRTTVAYGQFSRLSTQWLGLLNDISLASSLDNQLLGGRPKNLAEYKLKSKLLNETLEAISIIDKKRACEVLSFFVDLSVTIQRASKILKQKKYFCVVIGNRLVKGIRIPTDYIIAELAGKYNFECEEIISRNIPNKRMPLKTSPTNIAGKLEETMSKESIVILKRIK